MTSVVVGEVRRQPLLTLGLQPFPVGAVSVMLNLVAHCRAKRVTAKEAAAHRC